MIYKITLSYVSSLSGQDDVTSQKPGPFSQVSQRAGTQANMDELLNLCSGTFTEYVITKTFSLVSVVVNRKSIYVLFQ